jgi:hypothetical protein
VVPLDDAVFSLLRDGEAVGTEHVTLHRMGLGQDARIIGQSEILLQDGSEMRPRLEATTDMRVTTYQSKFTGGETGEVMVSRAGRRLVARTRTASGEAQREFRASDRTVVLEPEVVLLYYLLRPWLADAPETVRLLAPRSGDQISVNIVPLGSTRIRLGRRVVDAMHWRMEANGEPRDLWFDDEGRVLALEIPGRGFRAERQNP